MQRQSIVPQQRVQAILFLLCLAVGLFLAACAPSAAQTRVTIDPTYSTVAFFTPIPGKATATPPPATATLIPTATPVPPPTPTPAFVRFAVIADYGTGDRPAEHVADLVKSWDPDFIVTAGDNNYYEGEAHTIDENIGQFYREFIHPYKGEYGRGADINRFFPALGGHDWEQPGAQPYLDYFTLPGNERYYDVRWGPVHLFILDSNEREPDGVTPQSEQAQWLRAALGESSAPWKLVIMHDPPYSSGRHGSHEHIRWPFKAWGASAVISGDDHSYERLMINGIPYFVNGLGGARIYDFDEDEVVPGSIIRFDGDHGAMLVVASDERINFRFISVDRELIDQYVLQGPAS